MAIRYTSVRPARLAAVTVRPLATANTQPPEMCMLKHSFITQSCTLHHTSNHQYGEIWSTDEPLVRQKGVLLIVAVLFIPLIMSGIG